MVMGEPEGKRPLGKPARSWEYNINFDLQEIGCGRGLDYLAQDRESVFFCGLDCVAQDRDKCCAFVDWIMWLRTGTSVVLLWTGLCGSGQGQVLFFSRLDYVAEDRDKCCAFVNAVVNLWHP